MNELSDSLLMVGLALPWVVLLLLQTGWVGTHGKLLGKWIWTIPAVICGLILWKAATGGGQTIETVKLLAWLPEQGLNVTLQIDGLSLFFGLVVTGMGTLIFVYTAGYFTGKPGELKRFYTYLLFFLASMLGTVFSGNLLVLYIWWEMTGIASFFLIGYLHEDKEARNGARMALITTITTGMCLLAGILLVGLSAGTFEIVELIEKAPEFVDSGIWQAGFVLILIGAFGKSAQFPFHYWLPNAMAAPTPVSAYLHSATMVKLGIFLIARIFPIFRPLDTWVPILVLVGFTTFLIGASFALLSNKLKAILAFSTVSQLGFLVGFYGMTPIEGAHWDLLHIMNHVLYKGALFMVVGVIDHSTGIKDIRELGGLRKRLPLLYWITLLSAASMAGVIGTSGFLSKEYMLKEKLDYLTDGAFLNAFPIIVVVIGSILKVAFSLRFFLHIFHGEESKKAVAHFHPPSFLIQFPALFLTVFTVLGGLLPGLTTLALKAFSVPGLHAANSPKLKIWHGLTSPAFLISCSILLAGYGLYRLAERSQWRWAYIPRWTQFDRAFSLGIDNLPRFGGWTSRCLGVEHPKFHAPVLLAIALIWVSLPLMSNADALSLPGFAGDGLLVAGLAAALIICAGLCLVFVISWRAQVIVLGAIGFLITFYFVLYRAPDLALTQILVESASLVLVLILLLRFPRLRAAPKPLPKLAGSINLLISAGTGILIFFLTLVFSGKLSDSPLGGEYLAASLPKAKGTNAVNTILVDFRGFDTLLEVGVLVIATLGILGLLIRRKEMKKNA
jgi:multicomponent K+:H+ antiporter subunit A/multicomponent Na+:H+ antiporter subunit A